MLVTMSGPPGSGTSSAATAVADALGYEHVSGGDIFRELAAEHSMTVEEFGELAAEDETIDTDLDARLSEIASERDDVILESRLAGWMAGDHAVLRIWLDAPRSVRIDRIADRENWSAGEARERVLGREQNERERYRTYYDIDVTDRSIYDLIINTARWTLEAEVSLLVAAVRSYDPDDDEGRTPVPEYTVPFA